MNAGQIWKAGMPPPGLIQRMPRSALLAYNANSDVSLACGSKDNVGSQHEQVRVTVSRLRRTQTKLCYNVLKCADLLHPLSRPVSSVLVIQQRAQMLHSRGQPSYRKGQVSRRNPRANLQSAIAPPLRWQQWALAPLKALMRQPHPN